MDPWKGFWNTKVRDDGYVEISDLIAPSGLGEVKRIYRAFKELERLIADYGLLGWIAWTAPDNDRFIRALERVGGQMYWNDGEDLYFFRRLAHGQN